MEKKKVILRLRSFSTKDGLLLLESYDCGVRTVIKDLTDLCTAKYGGYIQLEMSPPYKKRTKNMNDKWWAMCTEFGNYCGMSKDDVAMGVKYRAMEEGLWASETMPFSKNGIKRPVSTTKANTVEMSTLIEVLYRIASEDGYIFKE